MWQTKTCMAKRLGDHSVGVAMWCLKQSRCGSPRRWCRMRATQRHPITDASRPILKVSRETFIVFFETCSLRELIVHIKVFSTENNAPSWHSVPRQSADNYLLFFFRELSFSLGWMKSACCLHTWFTAHSVIVISYMSSTYFDSASTQPSGRG